MVLEAKWTGESTHMGRMGRGWDRTHELKKYVRMRANVLSVDAKIYKYRKKKKQNILHAVELELEIPK